MADAQDATDDHEEERPLGLGVDRTQLRDRLRLSPLERIEQAAAAANAIAPLRNAAWRARRKPDESPDE